MTIQLRLFGELKHYSPAGPGKGRTVAYEAPEGATVLDVILRLGIPYGGEEGQMVAAVNDVEVDHGTALRDGDTLSLFEALAGG